MLTWAQQEKTVLCHVPGGDLSKAVTIETANPSAHIDIAIGFGVPQHELDTTGPCVVVPPPPPPPPPPDPPAPETNPSTGAHHRRTKADEPGLISCVLFPAYWEDPLLVLTNVTDEEGYVSVRTIMPDREEVSQIQVPALGRAELDNPDPTIRGFLEVKVYVADIRSVLEHDRPGKGLTREYGLPCWAGSAIPVYGQWSVFEMRDWWSAAGPN